MDGRTESVRRNYSIEELAKFHEDLVIAVGELRRLKNEQKQVAAVSGATIKSATKAVDDIHEKLTRRYEMVEVEIAELMDTPCAGVKRVIRLDNSETLREQPMSPEERQQRLFDDQPDERSES